MTSQASKKSKKVPARELDISNATRGIWLVKVPNYLADVWKDAEPDSELGTIKIIPDSKQPQTRFLLSEELAKKAGAKNDVEIPREHQLRSQDTSNQSISAFSESAQSKELQAEGRVTQRTDLQPVDSAAYMKLKRHQIKEAGKTRNNPVMQLKHTPVAVPLKESKAPKQLDKRARGDRDMVLELIFTLFQAHEFYSFKDLVHKTSQPPSYLKEILKEVCTYNTRAPHKNMWHLKSEYKHYQKKT